MNLGVNDTWLPSRPFSGICFHANRMWSVLAQKLPCYRGSAILSLDSGGLGNHVLLTPRFILCRNCPLTLEMTCWLSHQTLKVAISLWHIKEQLSPCSRPNIKVLYLLKFWWCNYLAACFCNNMCTVWRGWGSSPSLVVPLYSRDVTIHSTHNWPQFTIDFLILFNRVSRRQMTEKHSFHFFYKLCKTTDVSLLSKVQLKLYFILNNRNGEKNC